MSPENQSAYNLALALLLARIITVEEYQRRCEEIYARAIDNSPDVLLDYLKDSDTWYLPDALTPRKRKRKPPIGTGGNLPVKRKKRRKK